MFLRKNTGEGVLKISRRGFVFKHTIATCLGPPTSSFRMCIITINAQYGPG